MTALFKNLHHRQRAERTLRYKLPAHISDVAATGGYLGPRGLRDPPRDLFLGPSHPPFRTCRQGEKELSPKRNPFFLISNQSTEAQLQLPLQAQAFPGGQGQLPVTPSIGTHVATDTQGCPQPYRSPQSQRRSFRTPLGSHSRLPRRGSQGVR